MDHNQYLKARGWWHHPDYPTRWTRPGSPAEMACTTLAAYDVQTREDKEAQHAHGSVVYHPTVEQALTSPLLAACAARGMVERDVVQALFIESTDLRRTVQRLATFQTPPAIHISADDGARILAAQVKREQAIAAAWRALALAERAFAAAQSHSNYEKRGEAYAAIIAAKAALRALGIDPDAADPA